MIGTSQLINTFSRPCFTDTTDIFKDGSGVALYGLDYDASDAGGASGKFGEAAIFNGTSSYIDVSSFSFGSDNLSISMWIKPSSTQNAYANLFDFNHSNTTAGVFTIQQDNLNNNVYKVWQWNGSSYNISNSVTLTADTWNHLVYALQSNGNYALYLNGTSSTSGSNLTASTSSVTETLNIGRWYANGGSAGRYFNGGIDQVRIYNTALTSSQVTQLYQENNSTVGTHLFGCIANYNLDGSAKESMGTTAYDGAETDITYRYDGTPTNVDFGVGGKSNYGARFNGSSSYINLPDLGTDMSGSNTRTLSAWIKIDSIPTSYASIVSYGTANIGQSFGVYINSSGKALVSYYGKNWDSTTTLSLGNWYNIVGIYKGGDFSTSSNTELYINGQLETLVDGGGSSSGIANTSNTNYAMGYYRPAPDDFGGSYFNGSIDQVRIFSKALSSAEVSKLYGNGAGEIACEHTSTTDNIAFPITNTAYYKLDNDSKDSARSTGKFNEGAIFNGSSRIGTGITSFTNNLTISMWLNPSSVSSNGNWIFGNWNSTSQDIYFYINSSAQLIVNFDNQSGGELTVGSAGDFVVGNWIHFVVSMSSGNYVVYLNGVSVATHSTPTTSYNNGQDYEIGNVPKSSSVSGWNGLIDQVRIYDTALSSTDVSNLYAETASTTGTLSFPSGQTAIATYQLDGNSNDVSGNYNGTDTNITYAYDGTDTNVEYIFGRFGQAAVFSANGYISGLPTVENTSNEFSISLWFNTTVNPSVQHTMLGGIKEQGTNDSVVAFKMLNDGYSKFYLRGTDGTLHILADTVDATDGNWHHLVGTVSSSSGVFYVDGQQVDSATISNNITVDNLLIGAENNRATLSPVNYFNGSIDQVRIYSTALDSDQVSQLYNEKPEVDTSNFKAVLYEGNGNDNRYISNLGIDLETSGGLVWTKTRNDAYYHQLQDSVRGAGANAIYSNSTDAENGGSSTYNNTYGYINSFEANGWFTKNGSDGLGTWVNRSGKDYVAWCWKAGGNSDTYNVDGTGYSTASAAGLSSANGTTLNGASVNTEAGFSIINYETNVNGDNRPAHGLDQEPEMIIFKPYDTSSLGWYVMTKKIDGSLDFLFLNTTDAKIDTANNEFIDSTHFRTSFGTSWGSVIAYCFHSVSGYSRIGSYTGESAPKFVQTDFAPRFVLIKRTDSSVASWGIFDSVRGASKLLYPDLSNAEYDWGASPIIQFNSNGFTLTTNNSYFNGIGGQFIYLAIA